MQFIQDMNAESLRMDKEEFEAYTSGKLGVPLNNRESDRNMVCVKYINLQNITDAAS